MASLTRFLWLTIAVVALIGLAVTASLIWLMVGLSAAIIAELAGIRGELAAQGGHMEAALEPAELEPPVSGDAREGKLVRLLELSTQARSAGAIKEYSLLADLISRHLAEDAERAAQEKRL